MVERMVKRGYTREFAQNCYNQIKGFGSYGFPESHAASFAKLVYISSYLKWHFPDVFACALLNAQPMGFYAPAQIVRDAREHHVEVRPVDINHSFWDNVLEPARPGAVPHAGRVPLALRLGFRQAEGIHEAEAKRLVAARREGFASVEELSMRAGLHGRPMRALADADAFRSLGLDRRATLWEVRRLPEDDPLPLFAAANARELGVEADLPLPAMSLGEHVATDYQTMRLSLKAHPMALLRPIFTREGVCSSAETAARADGRFTKTAGLVLVRQRPGKGNAIFITLEDETGVTNCVLWSRQFEALRRPVMTARLMLVEGRVQRSPEGVVHLMASHIVDRSATLDHLWEAERSGFTRANSYRVPADEASTLGEPGNARDPRHAVSASPRHRHPRRAYSAQKPGFPLKTAPKRMGRRPGYPDPAPQSEGLSPRAGLPDLFRPLRSRPSFWHLNPARCSRCGQGRVRQGPAWP